MGGGGLRALKGEKIESFVAFTQNLKPKSLKTHHSLAKTSKINFLGFKFTIFFKISPALRSGFHISILPLKIDTYE